MADDGSPPIGLKIVGVVGLVRLFLFLPVVGNLFRHRGRDTVAAMSAVFVQQQTSCGKYIFNLIVCYWTNQNKLPTNWLMNYFLSPFCVQFFFRSFILLLLILPLSSSFLASIVCTICVCRCVECVYKYILPVWLKPLLYAVYYSIHNSLRNYAIYITVIFFSLFLLPRFALFFHSYSCNISYTWVMLNIRKKMKKKKENKKFANRY